MNATRQIWYDLLFNATLHIALFSLAAAALSPVILRLKANVQHFFYLGVLALSLATPVLDTFWLNQSQAAAHVPVAEGQLATDGSFSWHFGTGAVADRFIVFGVRVQTALLLLWAAWCLYRLVRLAFALRRVSEVRSSAVALTPDERMRATLAARVPRNVSLYKSSRIFDPVTIGFLCPAIVFPESLLSKIDETELRAVLLHECTHIRHGHYLVHMLLEALCLPVAWHPGMQYLLSKVSQTRELVCDEDAVAHFNERRQYARTLVRLASLCLTASKGSAVGIGLFNVDNLEDRIMKLTQQRNPLTRFGLGGLVLAIGATLGTGAVLARATSLHAQVSPATSTSFAGTWHWMMKDRSFATMVLIPNGSTFKGSLTGSKIALDNDGNLSKADPSDPPNASPITNAVPEGSGLHVTVTDHGGPFEFVVTLKGADHAEIRPVGAPANMKPIQAERAS